MEHLPHEVWLCILDFLSPPSLHSLALTCRHLHSTVSDPSLWTKPKLNKRKQNGARLGSILQVSRFPKITELDLSNMEVTSQQMSSFLASSLSSTSLQRLDLSGINLSSVGAGLLAQAVAMLHTVNLGGSGLHQLQVTVLLSHIITSTSLANLNLANISLFSGETPELLGLAVCGLTCLNLSSTSLSTSQAIGLFTHMAGSQTLEDVDLCSVDLRLVPEDVLSKGVAGLVKINLEKTHLTGDQSVLVFKEILTSTTLEDVNLAHVHLAQVPADLLGMAVATLVKADLERTELTREQFTGLMTHSLSSTTLEDLNVFYFEEKCPAPLPISDAIISQAVSRLKIVNLGRASLTRLHAAAVLKEVMTSKTLRDLNLQDVNLSRVDANLLADAVCRLNNVDLSLTKLTPLQLLPLLTVVASSPSITSLRLLLVDLSQVKSDLLAKAVVRLRSVTLSKLTTSQATAIFSKIQDSPSILEDLRLQNTNLSQVPPLLLAGAVARMKKADLTSSKLTTDQVTAILKQSINSRTVNDINLLGINLGEVQVNLLTKALEATNIRYSKHLAPVKMFNSQ